MALNFKTILFAVLFISAFVLLILEFVLPLGPLVSSLLAVIALILDVLAFSVRFYSYIFVPFLHMKDKKVVLSNEEAYVLSPTENSIITRSGDRIFATVFVKIPVYKSGTEMTDEERISFAKLFGSLATLSTSPVRITSQVYIINKDEYISQIRERLDKAEITYRQVSEDKTAAKGAVERANGEITMWHNMLDNIVQAESHALVTFATVTAEGGTDEEATNVAIQRGDEIAAGIGATLGVTPTIVSGDELLLFVDPERAVPYSTISEGIRENTKMQAI